jgi:membrane protein
MPAIRKEGTSALPSKVVSRHLPATAPRAVRIVASAIENFVGHEMSTYAAALAYRGLFALFPFIIFVIALVNALDVWQLFDMLVNWARTAPEGRVPTAIRQWMVVQARGRAEGTVISVGALAAIWAVASGVRVLRTALNTAAQMPEVQPAWLRVGLSFIAAPVLGALLLSAVALFMVTQRFLLVMTSGLALNDAIVVLWDWLRVPAGIVLVGLVISALTGSDRRIASRSGRFFQARCSPRWCGPRHHSSSRAPFRS